MARVGRLAGALLAETLLADNQAGYYLVGNTKQPCDWNAAGFEPPTVDPSAAPFVKLVALRPIELSTPHLVMNVEGEDLARALAQRFLVERNGSVSERLWRLIVHRGVPDDDVPDDAVPPKVVDANWLGEIPAPLWKIVRDTVLRCI
jgi:hypothetical protein